jgi:hypothetical protein
MTAHHQADCAEMQASGQTEEHVGHRLDNRLRIGDIRRKNRRATLECWERQRKESFHLEAGFGGNTSVDRQALAVQEESGPASDTSALVIRANDSGCTDCDAGCGEECGCVGNWLGNTEVFLGGDAFGEGEIELDAAPL